MGRGESGQNFKAAGSAKKTEKGTRYRAGCKRRKKLTKAKRQKKLTKHKEKKAPIKKRKEKKRKEKKRKEKKRKNAKQGMI